MIYLASPYSDPDVKVRDARFVCVCAVAGRLMKDGNFILSPIAHTHPIAAVSELPGGYDYWKALDRQFMDACNAIWVVDMPGVDASLGVFDEIKYMKTRGIEANRIALTDDERVLYEAALQL